jgi:hypothetical protein
VILGVKYTYKDCIPIGDDFQGLPLIMLKEGEEEGESQNFLL